MKKNWLALLLLCAVTIPATSQTLFSYGKYKSDSKDFLRAYNKNNPGTADNKQKAIQEYLDLYINSRLKIRQAYDRGYDSLPQIKSEVDNLRNQIIENYMSDPKAISRLTKEAFDRSQKDIHVAHIFIAHTPDDTSAARKKLNEVMKRLGNKEDFLAVAQQLSDDPSAKTNKGDINYITVFTLPYEFENVVYATASGTYSKPYQSKAGYHIFKNLGERKAVGEIKVQQILLAFPPELQNAAGRVRVGKLADSLYQRVVAGDDFGKLAGMYSNDVISANANGSVPDIKVGQYDAAFETAVYSLPKDGAISKPILTDHGYHIIKRVSIEPVVTNPNDSANNDDLRQRVTMDDRWKTARDFIYERVKAKPGVKILPYDTKMLWVISDSLIDYKPTNMRITMTSETPLIRIGNDEFKVGDWAVFAQVNRWNHDRTGVRPYTEIMDEFVQNSMYMYYRNHLEEYNEDFRNQMSEFKDGNLFFEIMQQEVWNKAQADSAALIKLYNANKSKYNWQPSVDAVVFFASDEATAKALADQLKQNPDNWKKISEAMNEKVVTDSGRYEWTQLPGLDNNTPKKGQVTMINVNTGDNTATFAYILNVYPTIAPRTFNEAKGLVMNDYQTLLEEQWIKDLKKKYPVKVDQKEMGKISR
jgi:peptidyl-prolyl cis-trans isomerase SurA